MLIVYPQFYSILFQLSHLLRTAIFSKVPRHLNLPTLAPSSNRAGSSRKSVWQSQFLVSILYPRASDKGTPFYAAFSEKETLDAGAE